MPPLSRYPLYRYAAAEVLFFLSLTGACHSAVSPRGVEQRCASDCSAHALHCGDVACARGCNLVLDRLVESEGGNVVACVVRSAPRCDDRAWAACGARVGAHIDGGPPAPPLHTSPALAD